MFYFPIYWECHHPNWLTHIFQRGGPGPPTRWSWHWVCPHHLAGIVRIVPRVPNRESFHIGFSESFVHWFLTYLPKTLRTQHHLLCGKKHCCGWTVLDHRIPRQSEAIRGNPIVAVVWDRHSHTRYRLADQDTLARGVRCHDPLGLLGSLMSVLLWRSVAPTGFIFVCCAQCAAPRCCAMLDRTLQEHIGGGTPTLCCTCIPAVFGAAWNYVRRFPILEDEFGVTGKQAPVVNIYSIFQGLFKVWLLLTSSTRAQQVPLPNSLRNLTFGSDFNESLERLTLPDGLESLTFGCKLWVQTEPLTNKLWVQAEPWTKKLWVQTEPWTRDFAKQSEKTWNSVRCSTTLSNESSWATLCRAWPLVTGLTDALILWSCQVICSTWLLVLTTTRALSKSGFQRTWQSLTFEVPVLTRASNMWPSRAVCKAWLLAGGLTKA